MDAFAVCAEVVLIEDRGNNHAWIYLLVSATAATFNHKHNELALDGADVWGLLNFNSIAPSMQSRFHGPTPSAVGRRHPRRAQWTL